MGVWKGDQALYFDLGKIDLMSFEFRLRPYTHWVEFTDVPLEAALPGAEVAVTELRPQDEP